MNPPWLILCEQKEGVQPEILRGGVISYSRAVIGTSLMAEICIMGTTATEGEDTVTLVGKLQIQQQAAMCCHKSLQVFNTAF